MPVGNGLGAQRLVAEDESRTHDGAARGKAGSQRRHQADKRDSSLFV